MRPIYPSLILLLSTVIAGCGGPDSAETSAVTSGSTPNSQEFRVVPVQLAQNSDGTERNVKLRPIFSFIDRNGWSAGTCISRDGNVVYGKAGNKRETNEMYSKDIQVFRWKRNARIIGFGQETRAVNPIASAQGGNVWLGAIANVRRETGISLFDNSGDNIETIAALDVSRVDPEAISQSGAVVVGRRKSQQGFGFEGFVWQKSVGFTSLGNDSTANDVSNDGVHVCGEKENADGYSEAFVWSQTEGFDWLGDLPEGNFQSRADCISGDGRIVVGRGWSRAGNNKLFIWSGNTGMIEVQGQFWSPVALDISDDGAIFVGYDNSGPENNAFVHSSEFGYERLDEYFRRNQVDTSDWKRFDTAESISADGCTILGTGTYKTGQRTAFLIDIGT